jgi:hypothetical protein
MSLGSDLLHNRLARLLAPSLPVGIPILPSDLKGGAQTISSPANSGLAT